MVANLLQTAKNRISLSSKEIVNGIFNTTTTIQTNSQVPAPVLSKFLSSKLDEESASEILPEQQQTENSDALS